MKRLPRSSFEIAVEQALRDAKLKVEVQPRIGGLRPDFLVTTPSGKRVVVEAKGWAMNRATKDRAIHQVKRYEEATGADLVYLVVPARPASWSAANVLSLNGLVKRLRETPEEGRRLTAKVAVGRQTTSRGGPPSAVTVFAAMPFASEFDDVFLVSMASAARLNGVTCVRVDRENFEGDVRTISPCPCDQCAGRAPFRLGLPGLLSPARH